jgi:hypothetical protein
MPEYVSPDNEPITYRRSQIRDMSPDEYAKNQRDIDKAVREGRVVDDVTEAKNKAAGLVLDKKTGKWRRPGGGF